MRPILSILAVWWAVTGKPPARLVPYCWATMAYHAIMVVVRLTGHGIDSGVYGFAWLFFNLLLFLYGAYYTWPFVVNKWRVPLMAILPATLFLALGHPSKWYLWMTGTKGAVYTVMGICLFLAGPVIGRVLGTYWLADSAFQYMFTKFDGAKWSANLWLLPWLGIVTFLLLGAVFRLYGEERFIPVAE